MTAPAPRLISDRLVHWATELPDSPALRFGGQNWTWGQWNDRLERLAGALGGLGIGRGTVVATYDKNSPACLDVTMAASAVGAAHAIANWRLSPEEVTYVLADSGAEIVFVGAEFAKVLESIRGSLPAVREVVVVGSDGGFEDQYEALLAGADPTPLAGAEPSDPALILYTSGTTGFPKGAMLTHANLNAHSAGLDPVFNTSHEDRYLLAMPLFHVGGTCPGVMCVYVGTPITLTREATPEHLFPGLVGATHAFFVPAIFAALLQAGEVGRNALATVKLLSYGAAPMPAPVMRGSLEAWPNARFLQVYGMTELAGAVVALEDEAHRDPAHPERLSAAGRAMLGSEVQIVDPSTLEPVAAGTSGEVWIRGGTVMAGYLNKPEATAEAITADGWMRTGDVGHLDSESFLFISDRVKDMIITGGENVYSPEVERVLSEHPDLLEVAVIGVPDDRWGESVKAVVVAKPGATVDPDAVIAYARERLAHFKAPRTVDVLDELPRNGTGKILKTVLRKPYWEGRDRQV
ncbi:long-chain-fatty-acid--CoA ligase [Sporichthya sp.]|uniref:long-chain-fatty-acid--CoA ligase n=1 Tax=Sporichthya sp. TaxID=65475 RepID=UPI0017B4BC59|nr:long-chain-fatty-acid--CoA ligase [Sporichthya sp.]MBA3742612.1 long-chain-fatty-acid--CoA ligase [Sporichthya sp.]